MRSSWIKCLVILLSLALASGNAHAALHPGGAHAAPDHEKHDRAGGKPWHHHHHPAADLACCCDCLGCTSTANLTPEPAVGRADLPIAVRYDIGSVVLAGRALLPEPDPPRPATLT
jgi:hypothetical protein